LLLILWFSEPVRYAQRGYRASAKRSKGTVENPSAGNNLSHSEDNPIPVDWASKSPTEKVLGLIDLQDFDGSWPIAAHADISAILGFDISSSGILDGVWTTLIVVSYLELKVAFEEDIWIMVVEKARDWLTANVPDGLQDLEKKAAEVVLSN
jgi:hypothetical protein